MRIPRRLASAVALALFAGACGGGGSPAHSGGPPGLRADLAVPAAVAAVPLVDQAGRTTSLGAFRGRVVVLAPFLTSCQEECPLTTGAYLALQRDLVADGAARSVALVELTVDTGRDGPSRLAAYAARTGAAWSLLTGTADDVARVWKFFGVYYARVPEATPAGTDWQTGRPYTYDVGHSNGFLILDRRLHERFLTADLPDLHGHLSPALRHLLDADGRAHLARPEATAWTVEEALAAISGVLGRPLSPVG